MHHIVIMVNDKPLDIFLGIKSNNTSMEHFAYTPTSCTFNYVAHAPRDTMPMAFHAGKPFTTTLTLLMLFLPDQDKEHVLLKIPCFLIPYGSVICNGPCNDITSKIIIVSYPGYSYWPDLATSWSQDLQNMMTAHAAELQTHLLKLTKGQSWGNTFNHPIPLLTNTSISPSKT